tara:strand:- start:47519 stop:48934 length:1416 start_codon:yes stop_codon:yes gene_type:complete
MGKYAVFLVLAFTISLTTYSDNLRRNQYRSELVLAGKHNTNQAKNIAYIVAEAAISQLNTNESYAGKLLSEGKKNTDSFKSWSEMGGYYNVKLIDDGDNLFTLRSTGKSGNDIYKAEVKINKTSEEVEEPTWEPDLPWALFVEEDLKLSGSAKILGDATSNTTENKGVSLTWSTKVTGDLFIGPGANIDKTVSQGNKQNGNVDGSIENLAQKIKYTLPAYPEYPSKSKKLSNIKIGWAESGTTLSYSLFDGAYIDKLSLESNSSLKIDVGEDDRVLYIGTLDIKQGHIEIVGDGKLTVFVEKDFKMNGSSSFNKDGEQTQVFMYYGGDKELKLAGSTKFNGAIYVEEANIKIAGSGGIQGHIISGGEKIKITGNGKAYSRMIYAPSAEFDLTGGASVYGAIVAKSFKGSGGTFVSYNEQFDTAILDLELQESEIENGEDKKKDKKDKDDDDDDDDEQIGNNDIQYEILYWN